MELELLIIEGIGLLAQALFILGYFLLERDRVEEDSTAYNAINLVAAILAIVYYGWFYAYAGVIGNIVWGAIAVYGFWRVRKRGNGKSKE